MGPSRSSPSWFRRHWFITTVVSIIVVVGLVMHFFLHAYLIRFVNKKLNENPHYKAHLDDIGVHLWRGAYSIEGLDVSKREGKVVTPFFKATDIDISVEWKQLFHHHIVAKVKLVDPVINVVTSEEKAANQTKVEGSWQDQVKSLVPFQLNRLRIVNGAIHWKDPFSDPPMDIYLHELNVTAYNLTNSTRLSKSLAATIVGDGTAMKDGALHLEATANPYEKLLTFKSVMTLKHLGLPQLNAFFKKYAAIEVHDGTFSLYSELAGDKGELKGYVKPIIDDLDEKSLKHEKKSPGEVIKGTVVEILITILTNNPKDRLGTRLQLSGRYDQPGVSLWVAITSAFRNAFIKAMPAKLDRVLNLKNRD